MRNLFHQSLVSLAFSALFGALAVLVLTETGIRSSPWQGIFVGLCFNSLLFFVHSAIYMLVDVLKNECVTLTLLDHP